MRKISQRGVTLVELLIVVSFIVVISVVSLLALGRFGDVKEVENTVRELSSVVREVQQRSVSGQDGKKWGMRFINSTSTVHSYEIWNGQSYNEGEVIETHYFRRNIVFSNPSEGNHIDVSFERVTGRPDKVISLAVVSTRYGVAPGILTISSLGRINAGIEEGLIGYWPMDEGSGLITHDSSGRENYGELKPEAGPPQWVDGKVKKSLSFNGTTNSVKVTDFGQVAPTSEITIVLWQNAGTQQEQSSIWLGSDAPDRINIHAPWHNGVVYWDFGVCCTDGRLSYTPPQSIVNSWQHFAFVASATGNYMRIYRNGVLEASKTGHSTFTRDDYDLFIGSGQDTVFFSGVIDEVRIYNQALSENEVKRIYDATR